MTSPTRRPVAPTRGRSSHRDVKTTWTQASSHNAICRTDQLANRCWTRQNWSWIPWLTLSSRKWVKHIANRVYISRSGCVGVSCQFPSRLMQFIEEKKHAAAENEEKRGERSREGHWLWATLNFHKLGFTFVTVLLQYSISFDTVRCYLNQATVMSQRVSGTQQRVVPPDEWECICFSSILVVREGNDIMIQLGDDQMIRGGRGLWGFWKEKIVQQKVTKK